LFAQTKGRPANAPLPCLQSAHEKIIELRKDFLLHDDTHMMIMLSLCTQDMNKYVLMFPDVWFIDCTAGELISNFFFYGGHFSQQLLYFLLKPCSKGPTVKRSNYL
jgi:hypothetical protein